MKKRKKISGEQIPNTAEQNRNRINAILDSMIAATTVGAQLDSFYEQKAAELRKCDGCFSIISKRFMKADEREKEMLVNFFRYWPGLEHIEFLQEFINTEVFWPRIGIMILELLNKSDVMVQPGMASMLLELDDLAQRLKQQLVNRDSVNEQTAADTVAEFVQKSDREKTGIIMQLVEEVGAELGPLLRAVYEKDRAWALEAAALIGGLNSETALQILRQLYELTADKDLVKVIKKTIHALKQKGVAVADFEPQADEQPVFKKIVLPEARAFVSVIDGMGDRIIIMIKPISVHETRVFEIFMNDVTGIHDVSSVCVIRKEAEQLIEKLTGEEKLVFVETTPEHACFLVEETYRINEQTGTIAAGSIAQWRDVFAEAAGKNHQPIIYACLDAALIGEQQALLYQAPKLFKQTAILFWFIESDEAKEGWRKVQQIKNSPLVLSTAQVEERLKAQYQETARTYFTEEKRALFKRRLEEVAYIYTRRGQDEDARIALCAALSMAGGSLPDKNPFCLSLVEEGFNYFESDAVIQKNKDSLIINPHDVSLLV
jgi:hypothetical protein